MEVLRVAGSLSRAIWRLLRICAVITCVVLLAEANEARAQNNGFTSTTTHFSKDVDTPVTVQGTALVAPTPLQGRLNALLATPAGANVVGILNQLQVLGPVSSTVTGKQLVNQTATSVTTTTVGPATIFVGDNGTQPFFVAPGTVNIDVALTTTSFFNLLVQNSQPLTARGINWLSGDLHGAVQTTILDNDFRFTDSLIGRGRDAGSPNVASGVAMSFAPESSAGAYAALAYAAARLPTKAPPLVPAEAGVWSAWAKGDGGWVKLNGDASNFGFRSRTGAGDGGLDYSIGPWLLGLGAGFRNSGITQEATTDSASINTGQIGAYGAWRGPVTVSGAATYGHHTIDSTRLALVPPMPSASSYGANSFGAGIEVSATRPWLGASIQPLAGLTYNRAWLDGFAEAGNPFLSIAGGGSSVASLRGYVGGRLFTSFEAGQWTLTPELRGRVLYDFLNDSRGLLATFLTDPTATPFFVPGLQPSRTAVRAGGGLNIGLDPRWTAFVAYDAEFRGGEVGQFASGGVRLTW